MKNSLSVLIILIIISVVIAFVISPQTFKRKIKTISSEYAGGMDRKLEVFDYNGNLIKTYEGKFDIQTDDAGKLLFDIKGKRHIIHGGIVIVEEL